MTDSIEKIIAYLRWHDYPFAYEAADRLEALLRDNVVNRRESDMQKARLADAYEQAIAEFRAMPISEAIKITDPGYADAYQDWLERRAKEISEGNAKP